MHESAPVRFWDHDLGPDQLRLFAVDPAQVQEPEVGWAEGAAGNKEIEGTERAAKPAPVRDLTPEPGRALDGQAFELTPDGTSVVAGWWQWDPAGESHSELVVIDLATGKRRVLLSGPEFDFESPRVSPDGRFIACLRERHTTAERPMDLTLVMLDIDGSGASGESGRDLLPGLDRWPQEPAWSPDSRALYFAADDGGRRPVFRVDPALSTGYGQEFIARAHRDWGARPFADIMAATEAVLARPDIDADRVGRMGGSYGGYMANWMAGHTDRFKAIVSHAGLWTLWQRPALL